MRDRILVVTRRAVGGDDGRPAGALHERLRRLGDGLLAEACAASPSRDAALTLLAADALMTFACQALAEVDPAGLADG